MNDKELLKKLEGEYSNLQYKVEARTRELNSVDFIDRVKDILERECIRNEREQLETMLSYLRNRISLVKARVECDQHHCGQDAEVEIKVHHNPNFDEGPELAMISPDILPGYKEEPTAESLRALKGYEVIGYLGVGDKCDEACPMSHYSAPCVKVELVGGDYLCLAQRIISTIE